MNPFIITEFIEWATEDYLEMKIYRKLTFSQILVQMIEALEELHSFGYLH